MKDKRIDSYIAKSQDFAKPVLSHLRELVHQACPDVTETMKWSFPHFDYKGMMCSMASFRQHCAFSFWKASLMSDTRLLQMAKSETAMGHLGKIKSLKDLPSDKILLTYVEEAMLLNESGVKLPARTGAVTPKKLIVPNDFKQALAKNKKALATFEAISYSNKKEYVEWVTGAKAGETRSNRLVTSIEWLSDGKIRNWKYIR